jgi:hypothetical protein
MKRTADSLRPLLGLTERLTRYRPPTPIRLDRGPSPRAIVASVAAAFLHASVIAWGLAALR